MRTPTHERQATVAILVAVLGLPLAGATIGGANLDRLMVFPPPLEIPIAYPKWSWLAFALLVTVLSLIAIALVRAVRRRAQLAADDHKTGLASAAPRRFPWWGGLALGWTLLWWVIAWARLPWFDFVQRYTFFPLWLGFVLTVNALVVRRAGSSMMTRQPGRWLRLFGISALFWWVFEWLNRFVLNWHYLGVEGLGPIGYAAHASLSFSTVLPAVTAVREWLETLPRFQSVCAGGPACPWLNRRATGVILLLAGAGALLLTGAYPQQWYPGLWIAPLALAFGAGIAGRASGIWRELAAGDWRRAGGWAVAALVCGFFWELWNAFSAAKWIYTVPYVERWHLFEMPLLGYAGYLGFGIECGLVVERLAQPAPPSEAAS